MVLLTPSGVESDRLGSVRCSGIQLIICVAAAVGYLAAVLGQMPRKRTFQYFFYGLLIELFLLVINMIF